MKIKFGPNMNINAAIKIDKYKPKTLISVLYTKKKKYSHNFPKNINLQLKQKKYKRTKTCTDMRQKHGQQIGLLNTNVLRI